MQRNKYLDDLGIPIEVYNHKLRFDKRHFKWWKQRRDYGFDDRETWNLDYELVAWLYSHCMMFKEKAGDVVELEYHKFTYDGKEYTQLEIIDYIIECLGEYLKIGASWKVGSIGEAQEKVIKALHLWAEVWPAMWW